MSRVPRRLGVVVRRGVVLAVALLALATGACRGFGVPRQTFSEATAPPGPDYEDQASWAALPWRLDPGDVPEGAPIPQGSVPADVFYIHPTTYASRASWNQPLDDEKANGFVDFTIRSQASPFAATARIYAPKYRQMTLSGYWTSRQDEADRAFELAYSDVRAAFEVYLRRWNTGRPIIIVGHSQGAGHGLRLLSEFFSDRSLGPSLRGHLVAAYLIGGAFPRDVLARTLPGLPLCETPTQTGCFITWNTVTPGSRPKRLQEVRVWTPTGIEHEPGTDLLCVNPVSWTTDGRTTALADHQGAVRFDGTKEIRDPASVTARCHDGLLEADVQASGYRWKLGGDLHLYDVQLFALDIRRNAAERVAAFRSGRR